MLKRALIVGAAALLAGCGSSTGPGDPGPSKAAIAAAFAGSPAPVASVHRQADLLLDGGSSAFHARLASLRGHPVVVNKWGSWCGPCRGEFPVLQRAAVKLGKDVAFLGLDAQDNDGDARKFLSLYPVTYPSYKDPDLKIAISIKGAPAQAFPTTMFFDPSGKMIYAHAGPYKTVGDLIADVRRYTR